MKEKFSKLKLTETKFIIFACISSSNSWLPIYRRWLRRLQYAFVPSSHQYPQVCQKVTSIQKSKKLNKLFIKASIKK
jgi:hypothetical protein